MQDSESETPPTPAIAQLNENHRRHLLASCQYIDRLLADIDHIVTAADSESPFGRYANDLSPALKKLLRDYLGRLRRDMLRILERHDSMPAGRLISAAHAIRTALGFVDISLEELKPDYIRGYGAVPDALIPEINGFVEELQSLVRALDGALVAGEGADIHQRLAQLEQAGADVSVLQRLDRVISEYGLVEFRPALETAINRLADPHFEIAAFGRVSSGKSSLLNHVLGQSVLPVGVTPITAVPTRVMYGATPEVEIQFADRRSERTSIDRLDEFVTEQRNPANAKHVARLIVRVPAPRLSDGIVFVDTPGLGSLATSGAAETLAYLPRCDLGIVLIDAASTLTDEDMRTVQRLHHAGIPAMVLLSKADLVDAADRERALAYTASQLSREFGSAVSVHAVSTLPGAEALFDTWVNDQLRPLLAQHRDLARRSVLRKIGALKAGVEATLRRRGAGRGATHDARTTPSLVQIDTELRNASGAFDQVRRTIDDAGDAGGAELAAALHETACLVTEALLTGSQVASAAALVADALAHVAQEKAEQIAHALAKLAEDSRRVLSEAARALDLPEPTSSEEWTAELRELPQMDTGELTVELKLPMLNLLGRGIAKTRVRQAIEQQAGPELRRALETHARLLRSWGIRMLEHVRRQFDEQAQVYRAQLTEAGADGHSGPDIAAALRDLDELPAPPP